MSRERELWYQGRRITERGYREAEALAQERVLRLRSEGRRWLTQGWLSAALGMSREHLNRILRGRDPVPRVAAALARLELLLDEIEALGVTEKEVFADE